MAWVKRIFFFALVNIAIMTVVTIITQAFGLGRYVTAQGIDHASLLGYCLVWGMVGSFISLALSKWMAKSMMGVRVIPANAQGPEGELVRAVHRLAKAAGISKMPEVGIYPSYEVNAFATGATKNSSLVAVSEGLLRSMRTEEVEGVLAHEVAHIANGDMVTLALIQGVVNAFVMYLARIAAYAVNSFVSKNDEEGEGLGMIAQTVLVIVFQIAFGLLGSIVVAWFSRYREFRADAGGAKLGGRNNMIAALQRLQANQERDGDLGGEQMAAFKISHKPSKFAMLFSTHPPLETRIQRLQSFAA